MSLSETNATTPKPFRLHGVNLFLTYPQCAVLQADAQATLGRKLKYYEWSIWAKELHEDGTPHLHAFVHLAKPCNLTSPTCLDLVANGVVSHGNYQVARDPRATLDYVCKGGDIQCFNIDLASARTLFTAAGRKRNATELILSEMNAGKPLTKIAREHPEHSTFIMLHYDRLKHFYTESVLEQVILPLTFEKAQTKFPPNLWDSEICKWLNHNIHHTREFSQKQLWIWGPTCHGKTTLKNTLSQCLRIYSVPNEDFYDNYDDSLYDLITFDEFNHEKKITWMNQFCDGSVCPLRQKGDQTVKKKNLPVIVLSNKSISQCYSQSAAHILATIQRRFLEIELGAPMEVEVVTTPRVEKATVPASNEVTTEINE